MSKFKVVVVDQILPITEIEQKVFNEIDAELIQLNCMNAKEIIKAASDADAVMTVGSKLNEEVISGLHKCKAIGRYGVGIDNVDLKAATEKNIVVTYVPVYCQEEVATLAITLLLACERRIIQADKVVKSGLWKNSLKASIGARSLKGKKLGLVGFGTIAREVVPLAKAFGLEVVAYDPYINLELCRELGVKSVELNDLLIESDFVSLHVPLLPNTHHMIGKLQFEMMKKEAILINTARGALIDQVALYEALHDQKIAAAGIDVLEIEPPDPTDKIFTLDNIITSGHIGAATKESVERLRYKVAKGVADVLTGSWPEVIANPEIKNKINLI